MLFSIVKVMILSIPFVHAFEQGVQVSDSCKVDSDCNDNDPCTVDTCNSKGLCSYIIDCKQCGLTNLITVDVDADHTSDEPSWEIINYETNEQVMTKNIESYNNSGDNYSASQCLSEGAYLFVIDRDSSYEVSIGDQRKLVGKKIESTKTHFFIVGDKHTRLRGAKNRL